MLNNCWNFVRVFLNKEFCAARCSHVLCYIHNLCTIWLVIKFHIELFICGYLVLYEGNWFYTTNCSKMRFYAGWNCVGSLEIKSTHTKKYPKITGQLEHAMRRTFIRIHPRIWRLPTQLRILIEISRIGFPGNLTKIFISRESASLTESETLFGLEKNSTGKKLASRNSA